MSKWYYKIRGLRQHFTDKEDPDSLRQSATNLTRVLRSFRGRLGKKDEAQRKDWEISDYGIQELDDIIEEMCDAGGIGDCGHEPDLEWLNSTIFEMWNWCDRFRVWVEWDEVRQEV